MEVIDVSAMRASAEAMAEMSTEPEGVSWTAGQVGGVDVLWADAVDGASDRVVQYHHGGGYVVGSTVAWRRYTGHLARAVGCRVASVDYRLAPEHPYPAAVDDAMAVYRSLVEEGQASGGIVLAGDSAGGGLVMSTLLAIREAGLAMPAAAVALSPLADLTATAESYASRAGRDTVTAPAVERMAGLYLQGRDPASPEVSTVHASLVGLCPLYLQVGHDESLYDDASRLAVNARRDGVDAQLEVFLGVQHEFHLGAGKNPTADAAIRAIGSFVRSRLGLA